MESHNGMRQDFCRLQILLRGDHVPALAGDGVEKYKDGFKVRQNEAALAIPFGWKKPAMVSVNSMSDLFHKDVPLEFIQKIFCVMNANPHLIFQLLTKRSERLAEVWKEFNWSQNLWMGVSVEDECVTHRIDDLRNVPAAVRFLSCEPWIGQLTKLNLKGIDWVIVGGESGAKPRPIKPEWATSIRDQCEKHDVAFFFKQWGGRKTKAAGRELDGALHDTFSIPKKRRAAKI